MYSNVDVFLNKKNEFLAKIEEKQPKIIALTEILPKNNEEVNEAEFDISGYNTFFNKSLKRGVILIIHKDLNAIECEILNDSQFEESVCVKI